MMMSEAGRQKRTSYAPLCQLTKTTRARSNSVMFSLYGRWVSSWHLELLVPAQERTHMGVHDGSKGGPRQLCVSDFAGGRGRCPRCCLKERTWRACSGHERASVLFPGLVWVCAIKGMKCVTTASSEHGSDIFVTETQFRQEF